jgi:hypothetical protein
MKISSDVNTIFAYADGMHTFHNKVSLYMAKRIRDKYILLAKVKSTFIYTYKDYLTTSCTIIDRSIREYKKQRSMSPSKTYKPTHFSISTNVDHLIDEYIKEQESRMEFNSKAVRAFVAKKLSEYSVPALMEDEKMLGEFREKYLQDAEERAVEILNKFVCFFRTPEFELMNIERYNTFDDWFYKIKESKEFVFNNKRDREDMNIAAEFLAYNLEFNLLDFFTCDREFSESIKKVAREYGQKIGMINLIKL